MGEEEFTDKTNEEIDEEELVGYSDEDVIEEGEEYIDNLTQSEENTENGLENVSEETSDNGGYLPSILPYTTPPESDPIKPEEKTEVKDVEYEVKEQLLNPNRVLYSSTADVDGRNQKLPLMEQFCNFTEWRRHNYADEYENTAKFSKWELLKRKVTFWKYGRLYIYDWDEDKNCKVEWIKRYIALDKIPLHAVEVTNQKRVFTVNYIPPKYRSFQDVTKATACTVNNTRPTIARLGESQIMKGEQMPPIDWKRWLIIGGIGAIALFCLYPIFMG